MIHRVVITGAESTGKTTLAQALANYYSEPWTGEFVREYVDQLERELQPEDLEAIARGQFAMEDAKLEQTSRLIIHDTNIMSFIVYAKHYFNAELDWVNQRFKERSYSFYLLCIPDITWEADPGQREGPLVRAQLHQTFKTHLDSLKLPYLEIRGTREDRLKQAVMLINQMLQY